MSFESAINPMNRNILTQQYFLILQRNVEPETRGVAHELLIPDLSVYDNPSSVKGMTNEQLFKAFDDVWHEYVEELITKADDNAKGRRTAKDSNTFNSELNKPPSFLSAMYKFSEDIAQTHQNHLDTHGDHISSGIRKDLMSSVIRHNAALHVIQMIQLKNK